MKILFLADGNSVHTQKWVNGLLSKGYKIFLFSLSAFNINDYDDSKNFSHEMMDLNIMKSRYAGLNKIKYFRAVPVIKTIIQNFGPDIVHAHFASSYGLLGALSGASHLITSVWGYDIFNFPRQSFLHAAIIKYVFRNSNLILSTSEIMAKQTAKYTNGDIIVTPFGVDLNIFNPENKADRNKLTPFTENDIVIGTVKLLEKKYGIEYMLKAFALLIDKYPDLSLKCCIVGYGNEEKALINLSHKLKISESVFFAGKVSHDKVPQYLNLFDIYTALSIEDSESFGVAIIEASACAVPVIVSNAGGLPEVVIKNKTGIVVEKKDEQAAFLAMEKLALNKDLRITFGNSGLEWVKKKYDWKLCLKQMQNIYYDMISQ